jgi:hypothetical protein
MLLATGFSNTGHLPGEAPGLTPEATSTLQNLDAIMGRSPELGERTQYHTKGELALRRSAGPPSWHAAVAAAVHKPPTPSAPACQSTQLPPSERLLLTANALPLHGSTGLHQALMTGSNVATLCPGRSWECEPALKNSYCEHCQSYYTPGKFPGAINAVPCISCAARHNASECEAFTVVESLRANLEVFEPAWQVQPGKRVLLAKWAPLHDGQCGLVCPFLYPETFLAPKFAASEFPMNTFSSGVLTPAMYQAGVRTLRWAAVFTHRPWCMWSSSSHAQERRAEDLAAWATQELEDIESLVVQHEALERRAVPVLLFSYAQMLWRPWTVVTSTREFAPCLGSDLDMDFVPKLHKDIWPLNKLKTEGSLRSYGQAFTPKDFGLNPKTLRCSGSWGELYKGLDPKQQERAAAAEEYLLSRAPYAGS